MAAAAVIKFAFKLKSVWTSWLREESSVLFRLSWPVVSSYDNCIDYSYSTVPLSVYSYTELRRDKHHN